MVTQAEDSLAGNGVKVHFEGVKALDGVDLGLSRGEVLGLIGPNGAGKTTMVNVLTGFQKPTVGRLTIGGRDLTGRPAHRYARSGVARTFQNGRCFPDLTVGENVEVGPVGLGVSRREARQRAAKALRDVGLDGRESEGARGLPAGDERRLQLARAMAMRPTFLFLDEPAAGLNESEGEQLIDVVRDLPRQMGCGVLIIEHDMRVIMGACDRLHVLDHGVTLAVGAPADIRVDPKVIEAYLGTEADDAAA